MTTSLLSRARFLGLGLLLAACADGNASRPDAATITDAGAPSDAALPTDVGAARDVATPPDVPALPTPTLVWSACGTFDCATLTVPADYAAPAGETFSLHLKRARARDPERRLGVIVTNPGGPGGGAVSFLSGFASAVSRYTPEVRDRFDIVAFDPRGVGESTPAITCTDGNVDALRRTPWSARTPTERAARQASIDAFQRSCLDHTPRALLEHCGTLDTVEDIDLLRRALGEDALNWIGFSYGTVLGLQYARVHPDRVRAFVLDSVADPGLPDPGAQRIAGAASAEVILTHLFDVCFTDGTACPLFHAGDADAGAIATRYNRLLETVRATPLQVTGQPPLTEDELTLATFSALYQPPPATRWRTAVAAAITGDGALVAAMARDYWRSGTRLIDAHLAILAQDMDREWRTATAENWDEWVGLARVRSSRMAPMYLGFRMPLMAWPVPAAHPVPPIGPMARVPPMLVVASRHDPITLYAFGAGLVTTLDNGSHLVTYEGWGHAPSWSSSRCTATQAAAFLVDPTTAPAMTTCTD